MRKQRDMEKHTWEHEGGDEDAWQAPSKARLEFGAGGWGRLTSKHRDRW